MRFIHCQRVLPVIVGLVAGCVLAPQPAIGENYALLVAVGDYDVKELRPLKYTRADVLDFHAALLDSGFPSKNVVLMHDDIKRLAAHYEDLGGGRDPKAYLPLRANIARQLELLLGRLRSDDSVIVALAGHGVQFRGDKRSWFCPSDAQLDRKDTLVGFDEIYAALKDCAAGRKLFLVDACQNDPLSAIARSRASVDLDSVTRPQTEPVPEGIIALFSCKAGQKSFEVPELGHGVFFHHLLDGWKGKGDVNGDGRLSYQELAAYTEKQTAEYAATKLQVLQTPQLKADFSGEWVLRELSKNLPPPLFDAKGGRTAAEAKASQEAWAKHLKTSVDVENSLGMKLRLIPPGEYLRGSATGDADAAGDEQPRHTVRISQPFRFGTTEVTRGQFRRFIEATSYRTDAEKDGRGSYGLNAAAAWEQKPEFTWKNPGFPQTEDHPVVCVSWKDATAFCEWLGREEGAAYRLPTEAEWEYACRAGTTTRFHYGADPEGLSAVANVADGTAREKFPLWTTIKAKDGYVTTAPAGRFQPNAFGLLDMHGNVWEWCADWYDAAEYARHTGRTVEDPKGPSGGLRRVIRSGSWFNAAAGSARRRTAFDFDSEYRGSVLGFRVLRSHGAGASVVAPDLPTGTKAGQVWSDNGLGMKFCWCPDGTFTMGSPAAAPDHKPDEKQVDVTLSGFWMAQHEVTQSEWRRVMGVSLREQRAKPNAVGDLAGEGPNHPIYHVSHDDAIEFCRRLTREERAAGRLSDGWEYRLPTEAQWEYACRAGTTTSFVSGNDATGLERYAWFSGRSTYEVGTKLPNAWGLHDMHGNVWEWCLDWYHAELPGGRDPQATTASAKRVYRGGCWVDPDRLCRSACRARWGAPEMRGSGHGLRVAAVRTNATAVRGN